MDKYAIAQIFREIATVIELTDNNPKKALAYWRASFVLESIDNFDKIITDNALETFPGIGKVTANMITNLYQKGYLNYHQDLMPKIPVELFDLALVSGLGLKRIKVLYETLGIKTVVELEAAIRGDQIKLRGFGPAYLKKILMNISILMAEGYSMLYPQAVHMAEMWKDILAGVTEKIEITGSLRRKLELVHQIDLIAVAKDPLKCFSKFKEHYLVKEVVHADELNVQILLKHGIVVNLNVTSEENFPFALLSSTGNDVHFKELENQAKEKKFKLLPFSLVSLKGYRPK